MYIIIYQAFLLVFVCELESFAAAGAFSFSAEIKKEELRVALVGYTHAASGKSHGLLPIIKRVSYTTLLPLCDDFREVEI
jgi:hypothetical protein